MEMPRIQYASSADGTKIACATFGSGPPILLVDALNAGSLEEGLTAGFSVFYQPLAAKGRVLVSDWRNTVLSGPADRFSLAALVDDVCAVVSHFELVHFDMWA